MEQIFPEWAEAQRVIESIKGIQGVRVQVCEYRPSLCGFIEVVTLYIRDWVHFQFIIQRKPSFSGSVSR